MRPERVLLLRSGPSPALAMDALRTRWPECGLRVVGTPGSEPAIVRRRHRIRQTSFIYTKRPRFSAARVLLQPTALAARAWRFDRVAILWNDPDGAGQGNVDRTAFLLAPARLRGNHARRQRRRATPRRRRFDAKRGGLSRSAGGGDGSRCCCISRRCCSQNGVGVTSGGTAAGNDSRPDARSCTSSSRSPPAVWRRRSSTCFVPSRRSIHRSSTTCSRSPAADSRRHSARSRAGWRLRPTTPRSTPICTAATA